MDVRTREIEQTRERLVRLGAPRLEMACIVLVTAAVGLLASFLMLHAGVSSMAVRYPSAILVAYGLFLAQMAAWARWRDASIADPADAAEIAFDTLGSWPRSASVPAPSASGAGSSLDIGDADLGFGAVLVLAVVACVALVASGWVVWTAPTLMAELAVDVAIAGGLYKRLRGLPSEGTGWLVVRYTRWPLVGLLVFFVALGIALQSLAPGASTMLQALHAL